MVLSACSPYFQSMFYNTPDKHPVVFLKDVRYEEMKALLEFMYRGEVSVDQQHLSSLLKVAESLKIKGLADVNESHAANLSSVSHHNPHHPHHHLPPLPLTTGGQHVSAPPPTLIPSFMSSTGGASPLLSPSQLPPSSKRSQTDSSPHSSSAFLGSKRKRGRPRRLSGSDAGPTSAISLCEERMDEGGINSSPIPDNSLTEHAQSPVKSRQEGNDAVSLSPTDLKTSDIPSEAESNDGRSSVGCSIRMVPKKRLYLSQSLGADSGTESFECESTGSAHSSVSSSATHNNLQRQTTSIIADDLPQPENLSLKKPDRDSRDSRDSGTVVTTSNRYLYQGMPKLEPKDEDYDVKVRETPLRPPYWEPTRSAFRTLPPPHHTSMGSGLFLHSPIKSSPKRLSLDSELSSSSCPSPYLMSYQFQEKVEAELANLYKSGGLNSLAGSSSSDPGTPISIRSFCLQDGNTYRCKVCNNAYTHPSNFHRHYVTTHLQRKSYPCTVCHKKFNRKDNMTAHLRAVHGWGGVGGGVTSSISGPCIASVSVESVSSTPPILTLPRPSMSPPTSTVVLSSSLTENIIPQAVVN